MLFRKLNHNIFVQVCNETFISSYFERVRTLGFVTILRSMNMMKQKKKHFTEEVGSKHSLVSQFMSHCKI